MKKEEILAKAKELINKNRQSTHGDCFKNHSQIADLWSVYLDDKLKPFFSKSMIRRMEKSGFKVMKK